MTEHQLPARTMPADLADPAVAKALEAMARRRPLEPGEEVVGQSAEWVEIATFVEDVDENPIGMNVVRAPLLFRHVRRKNWDT